MRPLIVALLVIAAVASTANAQWWGTLLLSGRPATLTPPSGVIPDLGPTFTGAIPIPAQRAGFTTMALNLDPNNGTTNHGVNWQNTATWMRECGAPTLYNGTNFNIYYDNIFANGGSGAVTPAPCDHLQIVDFLGIKWVQQYTLQIDQPANGGAGFTVFSWPATPWGTSPCAPSGQPNCAGGPNGQGLYEQSYIQATWFVAPQLYQNDVAPVGDSDPNFFYLEGCSACTSIGSIFNLRAFLELQGFANGDGTVQFSTDANSSTPSGSTTYDSVPYAPTVTYNLVPTATHTTGWLATYDGTNQVQCVYVDAGVTSGTPTQCWGWTGAPRPGPWGMLTNWLGYCRTGYPTSPTAECYTADLHFLFSSIQVWTCANYWNTPCVGSLVTSANEHGTRFAGLTGEKFK